MSSGDCFPTGNFCAYHSSFGASGGNLEYGAMPDVDSRGFGCEETSSFPTGDPFADAEINVASHRAPGSDDRSER